MAWLYGRHWSRRELVSHVGDISQLASVRLAELNDGRGRGVRLADVTTGSGFNFTILIDRGMDIGAASLNAHSLVWHSATGVAHPAYFTGKGWLRGFHGGLLVTCGLGNVGPAGQDEDGPYDMHGYASYIPAALHSYGGRWSGDDYHLWVEGTIRETSVFGLNMIMTRRIETSLGSQHLTINDRIENLGERRAPLMLLYHCNFGFPLIKEDSEIWINQRSVKPRDLIAEAGLSTHLRCETPRVCFAEQVFFHDVIPDNQGTVTAAIANPKLRLTAYLRYRKAELPNLIQWKQLGHGTYVVGLEPANCLPLGRATERERGTLQFLQPGEERSFQLEIGSASGEADFERLRESVSAAN